MRVDANSVLRYTGHKMTPNVTRNGSNARYVNRGSMNPVVKNLVFWMRKHLLAKIAIKLMPQNHLKEIFVPGYVKY